MSDLRQQLARLGLAQYFDAFTAEGFDTWETVLDITESDLSLLSVKLGHRRKLQRAIAESRGQTSDRPLPISLGRTTSVDGSYRSGDESGPESKAKHGEAPTPSASTTGTTTKRKYRRHPKPDEYAPERPPSAYVIFSNHVRELLKGQDLSFTEIAKVVGERWQVLPAEERDACERQANGAKEKYYAEFADYKKTPQYESYQKYLEDFRAKHSVPTKGTEGKRSKLESETSTLTRSNTHDQHERATNRRLSSVQPDVSAIGLPRPESNSPIGSARPPAGPPFPSKPTSPASYPLSTLNSPRTGDHYSPVSASPRSAMFDLSATNIARDPRGLPDVNFQYQPSTYTHPSRQCTSTTPPSFSSASHYQPPVDLPSRRPLRDSSMLPPLTREDTTWSSESGHSGSGYNPTPTGHPVALPPLDSVKTMRTLPQPIPSMGGPPSSLLDRPPSHPPQQILDYRTQGPLAALVRAGELAAGVAGDEEIELIGSP
ncbi:hypothetical protein GQ44DRAFT_722439 [Phaeosphaeriaceae sp. PMI808]|nr:hypothetical protein GQ44DRAFT_722439 [Phaeosphaeriaceae sp. PMI808]